jgi:ribosomal protein S8
MKNLKLIDISSCSDKMSNFFSAFNGCIKQNRRSFKIGRNFQILTILKLLQKIGLISKFLCNSEHQIEVFLNYVNGRSAINGVQQFSTGGREIFFKNAEIQKYVKFQEFYVISTNRGLKISANSLVQGVGGKLLFKIF